MTYACEWIGQCSRLPRCLGAPDVALDIGSTDRVKVTAVTYDMGVLLPRASLGPLYANSVFKISFPDSSVTTILPQWVPIQRNDGRFLMGWSDGHMFMLSLARADELLRASR